MSAPVVSVKTITYNHAPYIKQCMDGVLMQKTNFKFEFIIGEDCSTDGTREIVKEYAEKYPDIIKLITSDSNVGAGGNSKRTYDACTGKYIAFCEGDDYWIDPYKLQKQVDFLEANPDYGMVHTNCDYLDNETQVISNSPFCSSQIVKDGDIFNELINFNRICTLTVCYRKDVFIEYYKEVEPYSKGWKMGDYPMWLFFAKKYKVKYLSDKTSVYRVLNNSASHSKEDNKKLEFLISTYDIKYYFLKRYANNYCLNLINKKYLRSLFRYSILLRNPNILSHVKNASSLHAAFVRFMCIGMRSEILMSLLRIALKQRDNRNI
jgi:glycosyltransferase involved in cell wall biosynthesis